MNPLLLVDFYKPHHYPMYPSGMVKLYSNLTPRKSRMPGVTGIVVFGIQHFILTILIDMFNKEFFGDKMARASKDPDGTPTMRNYLMREYKRHILVDTTHIEKLWDLGYLPIEIKALDEGTICPIGVPCLTITNTHPDHAWLVNYLETLLSCSLWQPITSATIANEYRKLLESYARQTTGSIDGVQWQGHDFSMRGMSSPDSAITSGMGHLLSFTGTDTVPAIYQLERSYYATGLIGASVPATEHSVMCMGTKEAEVETFKRLLALYPSGILSVVSDTWDLWFVCTVILPQIKELIVARDGKLVIRPDSGDPVDIICGHKEFMVEDGKYYTLDNRFMKDKLINEKDIPACKGVIELLWDLFGGTIVRGDDGKDYKLLNSHIGAIYGDSITLDRAKQICERLKQKGFASTNIVLGIGSYTYQYNTRDTFGFAMKATYGEIKYEIPKEEIKDGQELFSIEEQTDGSLKFYDVERRDIFKDPITDNGEKKSAKGLLKVSIWEGDMVLKIQCTSEEESTGLLTTVFKDGELIKKVTFEEIRKRLR